MLTLLSSAERQPSEQKKSRLIIYPCTI
jgi:hypothetical protein